MERTQLATTELGATGMLDEVGVGVGAVGQACAFALSAVERHAFEASAATLREAVHGIGASSA